MAEGGTTAGNPTELDRPAQDASVSDFLAPYLLGLPLGKVAEELPAMAKGLGEAGEVTHWPRCSRNGRSRRIRRAESTAIH